MARKLRKSSAVTGQRCEMCTDKAQFISFEWAVDVGSWGEQLRFCSHRCADAYDVQKALEKMSAGDDK